MSELEQKLHVEFMNLQAGGFVIDYHDYIEWLVAKITALLSRAEKAEAKVKEWQTVAEMLADELNECNSERRPISWEDASESSPAWIAYTNLRDRDDDE